MNLFGRKFKERNPFGLPKDERYGIYERVKSLYSDNAETNRDDPFLWDEETGKPQFSKSAIWENLNPLVPHYEHKTPRDYENDVNYMTDEFADYLKENGWEDDGK